MPDLRAGYVDLIPKEKEMWEDPEIHMKTSLERLHIVTDQQNLILEVEE
jgi:hypothetical protein